MTQRIIVPIIAAALFLGVSIFTMSGRLFSSYVSFEEAKSGEYVQIIGNLDKSSLVYEGSKLKFSIADNHGRRISAVHSGMKPVNFEHADQAVLLGSYDKKRGVFAAERILVKCPSKYEKKK
jgi:cytochrome c-type biogenesis protein CcmE